jgi:hypothetical protein
MRRTIQERNGAIDQAQEAYEEKDWKSKFFGPKNARYTDFQFRL